MTAPKRDSSLAPVLAIAGGALTWMGSELLKGDEATQAPVEAVDGPTTTEPGLALPLTSLPDQVGPNVTERVPASVPPHNLEELAPQELEALHTSTGVEVDAELGRMVERQGGLIRLVNPLTGEPIHTTRYERIQREGNDFYGFIDGRREEIVVRFEIEPKPVSSQPFFITLEGGREERTAFPSIMRQADLGLLVGYLGSQGYLLDGTSGVPVNEIGAALYQLKIVSGGIEYWGQNGFGKPFFVYRTTLDSPLPQ